jgi:hypothetical protein
MPEPSNLRGALFDNLAAAAPRAALLFGIVVGGLVASSMLKRAAIWAVRRSGLETAVESAGGAKVLYRFGIRNGIAPVVGAAARYLGLLATLAVLADVLQLAFLERGIASVMAFLPKLAACLAILGGGVWLAGAARGLVDRLTSKGAPSAAPSSQAQLAYGAVLVLVSMVALDQLGLELSLLTSLIQMLIAATALAFALAFALGGAKVFEHLIARHYVLALVSPGDRVRVGGEEGVVVRVSPVALIIAAADGEHVIPCMDALRGNMQIRRLTAPNGEAPEVDSGTAH